MSGGLRDSAGSGRRRRGSGRPARHKRPGQPRESWPAGPLSREDSLFVEEEQSPSDPRTGRHSPPRSYYPRRRRRSARPILVIILLAAFTAVIVLAANGREDSREGEATIRIEPGAATAEIARLLKDADVISSEKKFMKEAEAAGVAGQLKPGTYRFQRGEPIEDILMRLAAGLQTPEGVMTIPEGYSLDEIAAELAAKTGITEDEYRRAAVPAGRALPFAPPPGVTTLEGYIFPSTYDLEPEVTADAMVDRQLETFRERTAGLPWEKAESLGMTRYEILTVASMVERETRVPEERSLVAAVIYNRLARGMRLDIDATVQYALGHWKEELTWDDLMTDSQYNTRLYPGLPPGPICSPGAASIQAALEPAEVDYLFYVAIGDEEGRHFFTSSYEEFLAAAEGTY
ncbi:MAG: endolytic transglycosylase MltG [Thermoleophilia bacterium]|nr:endolytic transglycosylase MltG [Thermoleophilia bacterium]